MRHLTLALLLLAPQLVRGEESVTVPWAEFRDLYRESIEREIDARETEEAEDEDEFVYSIDQADYDVRIDETCARGDVVVTGTVVAGAPEAIPLFGEELIISSIGKVVGGALIGRNDCGASVSFLPGGDARAFSVSLSFLARLQEEDGAWSFGIATPQAIQNALRLELPDGASVLEAPGIADDNGGYSFASGLPLRVRFLSMETTGPAEGAPPIVLESLAFFAAFEESGACLSTLVMDIPREAGPRLRLPVIADATIWSLRVNGKRQKVTVEDGGAWVIPLDDAETSHVELALLRQGEPLGLRGRLTAVIPAVNLSAQIVRVGIALPPQLQLLAIEGPVSPASGESWQAPTGFIGKPHYFARSFHRGEEMTLAVSYKEPVKQTSN